MPLFGVAVEGASRWVSVGPLSVQVSVIVLPAIVVLYARSTDAIGTGGILTAALALAAQPDRAMAGVLVAGIGAIVVSQRSRLSALALIGAVIAFAVTMLKPDALPAVPFVDRILYTAFDVHILAGFAGLPPQRCSTCRTERATLHRRDRFSLAFCTWRHGQLNPLPGNRRSPSPSKS
jgi:cell division protein FtsW (lipid II flippase)